MSAALATIAYAYLPKPWRRLSLALAVVVSFARVYVGAHLPLDVVGGAGLGVLAGSLVILAFGVPRAFDPGAGAGGGERAPVPAAATD